MRSCCSIRFCPPARRRSSSPISIATSSGSAFRSRSFLTAAWHERSAAILRERYRADDRVPKSVEVYPVEGAPEKQLAYFIRRTRALVIAEVLVGDGRGGLALSPSPALADRAALDHSLQTIAELPVELVLVSHGEPVLEDAKARMAEALAGG